MADRRVVKEVANAVKYSDGTILIKGVRFSYPHVLVPKAGTDDAGKPTAPTFGIVGMMPKRTHVAAKDLLKEAIQDILTANKIAELPAARLFLRNGDEEGKSPGKEMYKGHFLFSAREQESRPPSVRDKDGRTKLGRTDASRVYGGCWGNVLIRPWYQNNSYGKRMNAGLSAVQFLRDDAAFGEGRITEETVDDTFSDESSADEGGATDLDTDGL